MNTIRHSRRTGAARALPVLATSILALLALPARADLDTWKLFGAGPFNWSDGASWLDGSAPLPADPTLDVLFPSGFGSTVTNNDIGALFLNSLTFQGGAAETVSIAGAQLSMTLDPGTSTAPTITQNGAGAVSISAPVALSDALTLNGTGSGLVTISGQVTGGNLLTVTSGNWLFTNITNSWTGGTTITGGVVELSPAGGANLDIPAGVNSPIGNVGTITINGGQLKLTTTGAGVLQSGNNAARAITFGTSGGTLNINGITFANTGAAYTIILPAVVTSLNQPAIIKFNGGTQGTSNAAGSDWTIAGNALRIATWTNLNANNPVRVEITNGALMQWGGSMNTFNSPLTMVGVIGGDPGATTNEKTVGRVQLDSGPYNLNGGLTVEGVVQLSTANGFRQVNGNIAINDGGALVVSGRGTGGAAIDNTNSSRLEIGATPLANTVTVNSGGLFMTELRNRYESGNQFGVRVNDRVVLKAGGTLRATQSWMGASPTGTDKVVGWLDYTGDIEGQGSTAAEAVFDLRVGVANTAGPFNNQNGITFGNHVAGGILDAATTDLMVNGSGFGGLRINAAGRITKSTSVLAPNPPIYLFGADGSADPVTTDAKINNLLTATRLAALSGTGGYLTAAPVNTNFAFPAGGEWNAAVPVGLKVVNSNAGGTDVSFAALSTWGHPLVVDAGATLDLGGANPFTFTAGTLQGTGSITSTGSLQLNAGTILSPGLGNVGSLSVASLILNGTYLLDVSNTPGVDVVNAASITLNPSSALTVNAGSTFNNAPYTIATYTGTLTGTFGTVTGLPVGYSVDYATANVLRLVFTALGAKTWNGTPGAVWSTNAADANWQGGLPFNDLEQATFNDTAAGSTTVTVSGIVSPSSMTFANSTKTYTLNASAGNAVGGTGTLVKSGNGLLILNGPHSYSGGTTVNAGTLRIGSSNSLPDAGTITVAAGGTLDLNGLSDTVADVVLNGSITAGQLSLVTLSLGAGVNVPTNLIVASGIVKTGAASTISGSVNLSGGDRSINVATAVAPELTISGALSNGSITKTGNGTLLLSNATNSQTLTTVNAGTLKVGVVGAVPVGGNVTVGASGILDLSSLAYSLGTLNNSGIVGTGGAALTLTSLAGTGVGAIQMGGGLLTLNQTTTTSYTGAITGPGTQVIKTGSGVLGLSGTSTYTGILDIQAGRVNASGGAGGNGAGITVNPGTILQMSGNLNGNVLSTGGTVSSAVDTTASITGTFTINAPTAIHLYSEDNNAATGDFVVTGMLQGANNLNISISTVAGADNADGFRLRGTGTSTYSGTATLGPQVKFELQSTTAGNFSPFGTGKIIATAGTVTGGLNGSYSQVQTRVNTANLSTIFGNNVEITGAGVVNFNVIGAAGTTATMGDLKLGGGQSVFFNKNDAVVRAVNFSTVTLTGGNATLSVWDPSFGSGAGALNDSTGPSVQFGAIGQTAAGSGVIFKGSAASAVVAPAPHITITGQSSYTGPTDIQTGIVTVAFSGSLSTSSQIAISGATAKLDLAAFAGLGYPVPLGQKLLGIGDWDGRVLLDGTLSPGNNPGELATITGDDLMLDGGSTMKFELSAFDGSSDHLVLSSGFFRGLPGNYTFDFGGGGVIGNVYTLVQFFGTDLAANDFSFVNLGPDLTGSFSVTANTLDFTVMAVPEPATALFLLGGLAMLAQRPRRRGAR